MLKFVEELKKMKSEKTKAGFLFLTKVPGLRLIELAKDNRVADSFISLRLSTSQEQRSQNLVKQGESAREARRRIALGGA